MITDAPPQPFTVDELLEFVPLGLNHFTAFPAHSEYATDPNVAAYVKALDAHNLSQFATTYGYDESDQLDAMEATFGALKAAYPTVKTFTTAHMCGTPGELAKPMVPCYGTCPGPMCRNGSNGVPVQDPVQIKKRNIDYMCPILGEITSTLPLLVTVGRILTDSQRCVWLLERLDQARQRHCVRGGWPGHVDVHIAGAVAELHKRPLPQRAVRAAAALLAGLPATMWVHTPIVLYSTVCSVRFRLCCGLCFRLA